MVELQSGQTLGQYRILNKVGRGGMATVYRAYHAVMDRYVAIKVLSSDMAEDENLKGRFQQEARLIARLEHAHILPVHDFGESDGVFYIVMRYLDTGTLKERLENGPLDLDEIDRIFSQLTDALGYAHEHGVLHRDIKPSNALVDAGGNIYLTDFGIAKIMEGTVQFTVSGTITGTPAYMSPEQAQGERLDPRSDIYSLGIILYEMVTGQVPFEAETPLAVILKHLQAPLPLPSEIRPEVHPAVERLLLRALAKDRNDRFDSCQDFLTAWKQALAEARVSRVPAEAPPVYSVPKEEPPTPRTDAPTVIETQPDQTSTPGEPPPTPPASRGAVSRKTWRTAGIISTAVLLILAVLFFGWRLFQPGTETAESGITPGAGKTASEESPPGSETIAAGPISEDAVFTSWTGANIVTGIQVDDRLLYASGQGGVTVWNLEEMTIQSRITTASGFPNANVLAFRKDETGSMWVATEEGLYQISGDQAIAYTQEDGLDSEYITTIIEIEGQILAGSQYSGLEGGGLNLQSEQGWTSFDTDFPSAHPDEARPNQLSNAVNVLLEADGVLWVGTTHGLGRFDGESWVQFHTNDGLPDENVLSLLINHAGQLIAGTEGGAAIFDGKKFDLLSDDPPDGVYGIAESPTGIYWLSGGGGIWRFDSNVNDREVFSAENGRLPVYETYGAQAGPDGGVYFGSHGAGLVIIRPDGSIEFATVPNTPTAASFAGILRDPNGMLLFLASNSSTVDMFDPNTGQWSAPPQDEEGFPIYIDDQGWTWANEWPGGVWLHTSQGQTTHITDRQGLPEEAFVNSVAVAADGTAWFGTSQGLAHFDGTEVSEFLTTSEIGLQGEEVYRTLSAQDGSLWVTGYNDFVRRDPDGAWQVFGAGNPLSEDWIEVYDIDQDTSGAVWVGTGEGAYRYAGGDWTYYTYGDPGVGLPAPSVLCVSAAPDGSVWFGTRRGAARFDGENWQSFAAGPDGLISGEVLDILALENGEVFFATAGGVTRLQP